MKLAQTTTGFTISHKNRTVFEHSQVSPALYLGIGQGTFDMYRGNFDISDYVSERLPLKKFAITENSDDVVVTFSLDGEAVLEARMYETAESRLKVEFTALDEKYNRFWARVSATESESVYGCGEQLSYLNLHRLPFAATVSSSLTRISNA